MHVKISSDVAGIRARLGNTCRNRPEATDEIKILRRDLKAALLAERICEDAAQLDDTQRARLAALLLRGGGA
ncbi:hypothetical protein [Streptomyces sp. TLI_185]|uniref:hypothetical protein n=1 Tax=Streptomyces sp. TLI_185 TaxID=2485151 RepID=UPI000F4E86F9|nr:hypothetical protein [Streptomyces sp. TLI_185]RPF33432.1 hypothetical protein EDD92_3344 [Streptomyces sp. TLI_185]